MNPGMFDRTITIESYTEVNEDGSPTRTYAALFSNIAAWVKHEKASESIQGDRLEYEQPTIFQIPFPGIGHGINNKSRITFDSKYYNVTSVEEVRRREGLLITGRLSE